MVKFSTIVEANASFADSSNAQDAGLVCVFSGATGGVGAGTIEKLAVMLKAPTFYVLGRSETKFSAQRAKLQSLNPDLKLLFVEVEVSLISGIDLACKQIITTEKKVDYLYMSQGCIPLSVPQYTKEGLDISFALSVYSRMRLLSNLLPLLRRSIRPRVLSVCNGGREARIKVEDDIGLQNPTNFAHRRAMDHMTILMTLSMEYLADNDSKITFMHSFPGLVATDIFTRLSAPPGLGVFGRLFVTFLSHFVGTLQRLLGMSIEDCGARQAFILTDEKYGPGEMWRINEHCEPVTKPGVLAEYRERGWRQMIWDYTLGVFEKALTV